MKIAHISDLHFCDAQMVEPLSRLVESVKNAVGINLEMSFADPQVTDALRTSLLTNDPDVIVVSGDVTTCGDAESFKLAYKWLSSLLARANKPDRSCVVVPGNHDALRAQLAHLLHLVETRLPWYVKTAIKTWLRAPYTQLKSIAGDPSGRGSGGIFAEYLRFANQAGLSSDRLTMDLDHGQKVVIHPFGSVNTNPLWMNLGQVTTGELEKLRSALGGHETKKGALHIVVLHHNPISSAEVVPSPLINAYNSMPAGVQLLRTLQTRGVDVILHGHQHEKAMVKFDFDLEAAGHAFGIGTLASTASDRAGFNIIDISDINHISVKPFEYARDQHEFVREKGDPLELCLERNRPAELTTVSARYEIKNYVSHDQHSLWDEVLKSGSDLIYISGRQLSFVVNEFLQPLRRLLQPASGEPTHIRMLVSNPDLLRRLAEKAEENGDVVSSNGSANGWIWGRDETLLTLASEAEKSIDRLRDFIAGLSADQRLRIDVRMSHTLMPFAATVRDADKPWGKMVVRLFPVGAIGDLSMPVLKLHRRRDGALYDYYLTHMRYLLAHGKTVLGDWDRGNSDLKLD